MTRRRRAACLLGLALVLGGLAASRVAQREAAAESRLGPLVARLVAARDLPAGRALGRSDLAVRRVPLRYAPPDGVVDPLEVVGREPAVPLSHGGYLSLTALRSPGGLAGAPIGAGERAAEVVALGSPRLVVTGGRVDVLVTREGRDGAGGAELALEDVEVLAARRAAPAAGTGGAADAPRVSATLRVTVRQAVFLAAAQSFAREVRLLPRGPGDTARAGSIRFGSGLR